MFNICLQCGTNSLHPEIIIEEDSYFVICSTSGNKTRFRKYPLFLILGASGTGKSTVCQKLVGNIKESIVIDADIFWRREFNQPESGFYEFKNFCLKVANNLSQNGFPVIFFLQGYPEDLESCAERKYFSSLHYLFLVCDEEELKKRLQNKPKGWGLLDVNENHLKNLLEYNERLKEIAQTSDIITIDTSLLTINESVQQIHEWLGKLI